MDLIIRTAGVTDISAAAVTSASDLTALTAPDELPQLVLGTTEPMTVKFVSAAGTFEAWSDDPTYEVMIALGIVTALGTDNYADAELATVISDGKSGNLALDTVALVNAVHDAMLRNRRANTVQLVLQVYVTDPSGNRRTYAMLPVTLWGRVPTFTPTNDPLVSGFSYVQKTSGSTAVGSLTFGADSLFAPTLAAPSAYDLTLEGGDSGASVVLKKGTNGNIIITPTSDGGSGHEFVQVETNFTGTQTANLYGVRVRSTLANAGTTENITWANAAVLGEIATESTNAHSYSNRQHGLYGYVNHQGAGLFGLAIGAWGVVASRGAGGMTAGRAFDAHMFTENVAGTGAVNSFTGFHMRSCTATGGTIGTIYGLYVDKQTAASTNWAVYTAGATPSYFGGQVTVANWIVGCTAENSNVEIGADARASNLGIRINTAAGRNRYFGYYSAGVLRWFQAVDFVAESGANAGSDWSLSCYADDGSFIATAIKFTRATGAAQFGGPVTLTGGLVSYGANDSGGAGYRLVLVPNA